MYKEEIIRALESENPVESLQNIARLLDEKGISQKEIYEIFYNSYIEFQKTDNTEYLNVLGDVMDMISGWFVGKNLNFKKNM